MILPSSCCLSPVWQSSFKLFFVSLFPKKKLTCNSKLYLVKMLLFILQQIFLEKKFCMSLPVCHHVRPEKHCFAELPTPTNTGLPMCQISLRIPVQGMLFGRKLGLYRLDGAVQLFYSFERSCSSFSKTLPSASVLQGLALFEIWEAFLVLPFTFALKAPQALNHKVIHPHPPIK